MIIKHEIKSYLKMFIIWTSALTGLLLLCIFIYPALKLAMNELNEVANSMGSLSDALQMGSLNFNSILDYYAIECASCLGLGGSLFAAILASGIVSKEEKDKTGDFIFTHPVRRSTVLTHKLLSCFILVFLMNLVVYALSLLSIVIINEPLDFGLFTLVHLSYLLLQLEICGVCFFASACLSKGSMGIGLGITLLFYSLAVIGNLSTKLEFIKYITPFGYAEGPDIISNNSLDYIKISIGIVILGVSILLAYIKYNKKDLR